MLPRSVTVRPLPAVLSLSTAACLVAMACGDPAAPSSARSETRDSVGITIVTNARPAPDEAPLWSLALRPTVSIGVLEGAEPYLLAEVGAVLRMDDRRIVLANGGTRELRFYDAEGTHLRSVGGEGEGPGEFLSLSVLLRLPGDSLGVWDFRNRRLTVLGPDGELGRTIRMEETEEVRMPYVQDLLPDTTLLAGASTIIAGSDGLRNGLMRQPSRYLRYDLEGAAMDPVLTLPGSEAVLTTGSDFISVRTAPYARRSYIRPTPEGFVAGPNDIYELGFYDPAGRLLRILRTDHPVRPVDDALRAAFEEAELAEADDGEARAEARERLESLEYPPSIPAFGEVRVDAPGNVWVRDYRLPSEPEGPERWLVYDPEGRILGAMDTPPAFSVSEIGEDYVLGTVTDALDVERVLLFRLDRGS